jgi:hypothetical protein
MKRIIASVGFAALGASTLHAQYSPGVTSTEMQKEGLSVAGTVREFYDDNYLTRNTAVVRSWGEEVSPAAVLNYPKLNGGDTSLHFSYVYDMLHYDHKDVIDSSHQFNASVIEKFSDRYRLQVGETFINAQEPTVLSGGTGVFNTPLFMSGANTHNNGALTFTAGLTPELDLQLSYANDLWAYQQTFGDVYNPPNQPLSPSYSALLDRMSQPVTLNLNWKIMEHLTGVLGYTYENTAYTSPEPIAFGPMATHANPFSKDSIYSQVRNNDSHFFFVGGDWNMASEVIARLRVGGEYLDYYKAGQSTVSPYVDASVSWNYMQNSTMTGGVTHQHSATDVVGAVPSATGPIAGQPVLDAETTSAYLSLSQAIPGGLTASVMGQYQHSSFNGGTENGQSEDFFVTGLNLAYRVNTYLVAESGYNWNKLVSDVSNRDYTRNIVYLGVRASY